MDTKCEIGGHLVYCNLNEKRWRYADTDELYDINQERPCKHCGKSPTKEGYDACLGKLPNVEYACCGHNGEIQKPYAIFMDKTFIEFKSREEMFKYFGLTDV